MANFPKTPNLLTVFLTLSIGVVPSILLASDTEAIRLSEPVAVSENYEFFGATLPEHGQTISLSELIENSGDYLEKEVLVKTRIAKVCQKKGCFFVATEGASSARITFKDYGFFIPTDSGGKDATVVGVFSRQPISKKQAEHFAEDLGEIPTSEMTDFEYSIVASAVRLPLVLGSE